MKIILASSSPRRKELLEQMGLAFEICPSEVSEALDQSAISPAEQVEKIALKKAEAIAKIQQGDCLVIGADTIVVIENEILGKPIDRDDADRMLQQLSDRWHDVMTAVALIQVGSQQKTVVACEKTRVKMNPISTQERWDYIATGEPMDKAGAYAVQGIGSRFVAYVGGDYTNVVGLPIPLLRQLLKEQFGLKAGEP